MKKGAETRDRILHVAAEMFWRRSFHGLSMDDLAAAAKVNKATLYRYFPSKEALARAVIDYDGELTLQTLFAAAGDPDKSPGQRIEAIYDALYEVHEMLLGRDAPEPGCPIAGLSLEIGNQFPAIRDAAAGTFARTEEVYRRIVVAAQQQGAAAGWSVDSLAALLMQIQHGALISAHVNQDRAVFLRTAEAARRLVDR